MNSLPIKALNYLNAQNLSNLVENDSNIFLDYHKNLKIQRNAQGANFDKQAFDNNYFDSEEKIENFKSIKDSLNSIYNQCNNSLSNSKVLDISKNLNNYKNFQKNIKLIFNYNENESIESIILKDDNNFSNLKNNSKNLYESIKKEFKEVLKDSKKYNNISIKDFLKKGMSEEQALKNYAISISRFPDSKESKEVIKEDIKVLKKSQKFFKKIKMNKFEKKRLKQDLFINKYLVNSGFSQNQIDDILGKDYNNKQRWRQNNIGELLNIINNTEKGYSNVLNNFNKAVSVTN